jgi:hypothetical protein
MKQIKKKKNITAEKDFELFRMEFLKWYGLLGLQDWDVYFDHRKADCEAGIDFNWLEKTATITLSIDWEDGTVSDDKIKEDAMHEAMHLLICPLDRMAKDRYVNERDINRANEDIVRRIVVGINAFVLLKEGEWKK